MPCYNDDHSIGMLLIYVVHDLKTIHIRQNYVQKDKIKGVFGQTFYGFMAIIAHLHFFIATII